MNGNIPRDSEGRALTRQEQLLLLIEQNCQFSEDGSTLLRFYVPQTTPEVIVVNGERYDIGIVYGGGDAQALKALERRGWIKSQPKVSRYSFSITENGMLKAQELT